MELIKPKINSVLKYHGGKSYLAKDIIPILPDCEIFVDATVGAGNIILNTKPDSYINRTDVAIDIDEDLIRMWRTVQKHPVQLSYELDKYEYKEEYFTHAKRSVQNRDLSDSEWSAAYIVKNRMSRGGLGKDFAWSERLRGGKPGDVNAWENFLRIHYPRIVERVQSIDFLNGCMRYWLNETDIINNPNAVVYIDPPYVFSSRTIKKIYKHEIPTYDKDTPDPHNVLTHEGIWAMIRNARCRFYVSGYYSKVYEDFGARVIFSKDIANHSGQSKKKQRRTEILWSR